MGANLLDSIDYVVGQLATVGIRAVTDPRNVTPPCVLVEPPIITAVQSANLVQLEIPVSVIAPPPGNRDAIIGMLALVDDIIGVLNVTSGSPGTYVAGNTELPAYNLNLNIQIRRT